MTVETRGTIKGMHLRAWRKSLGWSRPRAALELQMPIDTLRQYERDKSPIPGVVEVAIQGLTLKNIAEKIHKNNI